MFDDNKVFFAPALPLEDVVDPTGAGDTFAGGFIGYLAHTDNISFETMHKHQIKNHKFNLIFTCRYTNKLNQLIMYK